MSEDEEVEARQREGIKRQEWESGKDGRTGEEIRIGGGKSGT